MQNKIIQKMKKFGKIGNVIVTILLIAVLVGTVAVSAGTIYLSSLPKDSVLVTMTNNARIQVNREYFLTLWNLMTDNVTYAADKDLSGMLSGDTKITPPEDRVMQVGLAFFRNNFSSAIIHTEGNEKVIDAATEASVYKLGDAIKMLICGIIFLLSVIVSLWMLKSLFKAISKCDSPFSETVVRKMRGFGFSLIPVAVFSSAAETVASVFLSAGRNSRICVQWGVVAAFLVTTCLVTFFRYGVQLQRESDETL